MGRELAILEHCVFTDLQIKLFSDILVFIGTQGF